MSGHSISPANAETGFRNKIYASRNNNLSSGNNSEQRIRFQPTVRTASLNRLNLHNHIRPLARASSSSSIGSNSLGRRRREVAHIGDLDYTMSRGSISEGNLAAPVGIGRDFEDLSDTESLDGRRVRVKYTGTSREGRTSSLDSSQSDHNISGDLSWRSCSVGSPDATAKLQTAGFNGQSSSSNQQFPRELSQEARKKHSLDVADIGKNLSESKEASESSRGSTTTTPVRKDSEQRDPVRSARNSNASSRVSAIPCDEPRTPAREPDSILSSRISIRDTNSLNPSPSRIRAYSGPSGSDLTSSIRDRVGPSVTSNQSQQPFTELVLPRWQADAEVTFCPICRTQFSFFVRKHHCRKCGRVVCNSCSPHRITIPYQFIVQPPTDSTVALASSSLARPLSYSSGAEAPPRFTTIGGGERVRLCNPCVPDPNTAPPQTVYPQFQHNSAQQTHSRSTSLASPQYSNIPSSSQAGNPDTVAATLRNYPRRTREPSSLTRASVSETNSYTSPGAVLNVPSGLISPSLGVRARPQGGRSRSSTSNSHFNGPERYSRPPASQHTPNTHYPSLVPRDDSLQERSLPHPPRLAEEDECPVCHHELPPSGRPDSEVSRAAHINQCIESAFGGYTAAPPLPPAPPVARNPSLSTPSDPALPIANTPEARAVAREQAHAAVVLGHSQSPTPIRRTGVFPYKATEKDCIDDAECTICLEEFEVGEEMGRLECFCRFHLRCIRQWFELHYGQCPVHQHDGGY